MKDNIKALTQALIGNLEREERAIQSAHQELDFNMQIVTLENYFDWVCG